MSESFSEKRKKIYDYIAEMIDNENFNPDLLTIDSICTKFNYNKDEVKKILRTQTLDGDLKSINIVKKFFVPSESEKYKKISKKYEKPYPVSDFFSLIIGFLIFAGIALIIPAFRIPLLFWITTNVPLGFLSGMLFIIVFSYLAGFFIYRLLDLLFLRYEKIKKILQIIYPVIALLIILFIIFFLFTVITKNEFDNTMLIALFTISITGGLAYSAISLRMKKRGGRRQ